jgi:hypothetical protein
MTYLNGPAIAHLLACSRMSANEWMRAGHFGPLLQHDRVAYAAQAAVERYAGRPFTAQQLAAAVGRHPDRIIEIHQHEEEADGPAFAA